MLPTAAQPNIAAAATILGQSGLIAGLLFGCVVLGACGWILAETAGWYRSPTVFAVLGLVLVVGVAVIHPGEQVTGLTTNRVAMCLHDEFSPSGGLRLIDFGAIAPFAFFSTIATRRPTYSVATALAIVGLIDLLRAYAGLGVCEKQDYLSNAMAIVIAALTAHLILLAVRPARPPRRNGRIPESVR